MYLKTTLIFVRKFSLNPDETFYILHIAASVGYICNSSWTAMGDIRMKKSTLGEEGRP